MRRLLSKVAAIGFWSFSLGIALDGCGSRLGPVQATQSAGWVGHPNLPDMFVEKSKQCVAEYAQQMEPGRIELSSTVKVDEYGDKLGVTLEGVPETAPDFGACMRNVLRDMPIAEEPFQEGVKRLRFHLAHARDSEDALIQFLETIPGIPIVQSKLVLEVDGYTVVLPVEVKVRVVDEQVKEGGLDKPIMTKIGRMAIDTLGYDEIMRRAEDLGWVKTVRAERAQIGADKKFIGDVPPPAAAAAEAVIKRVPPPVVRPVVKVVEVVATRVFTKTAPIAFVISQADTPAPGIGDAAALGLLVLAMVAVGGIVAYEIMSTPSTTAAPAPPTPATTPTAAPTATVTLTRRWPNQTCEDTELDRLEEEKKKVCKPDEGFATICPKDPLRKKSTQIPCSLIKRALLQRLACKAARWDVENKCFGGKPDDGHQDQIDQEQNAINNCDALKVINCAKGHPMANL